MRNSKQIPRFSRPALLINRDPKGFTLIELLVVISIMVAVFGLGYANFRDFQRRQHLGSAVRMVKADLRLAQEMALAGRKPSLPIGNVCETSDLLGYIFDRINDSSYSISASCVGGDVIVKGNIGLPPDVVIAVSGGVGDSFRFNVLGRGIDWGSSATIRLTLPGVSLRQVIVNAAGEIR